MSLELFNYIYSGEHNIIYELRYPDLQSILSNIPNMHAYLPDEKLNSNKKLDTCNWLS